MTNGLLLILIGLGIIFLGVMGRAGCISQFGNCLLSGSTATSTTTAANQPAAQPRQPLTAQQQLAQFGLALPTLTL